jgi:putative transposase
MVPYVKKVKPICINKVCAIDPGVRTFMTGYDPSGQTFEISHDNEYILKKKRIIKQLQAKLSKVTDKVKRFRITRDIQNLYRKMKNYILDLHHKASKLLSENYSEVILPIFETKKMVQKEGRKINSATANNMMILSHYKFRQLLNHKMAIRSGKLHLCTEEYTSKTCSICGRLNHYLGPSKVFECPFEDCGIVLDRDINAARNIYIKNYNVIGS